MARINKDEILIELLRTLVSGWSKNEVLSALDVLEEKGRSARKRNKTSSSEEPEKPDAADYVRSMDLGSQKAVIVRFAEEFDRGHVLAGRYDIRRFLESHGVPVKDIKTRNAAFRKIVPVLARMSEKGLLREIDRTRFSGPAQLDDISDAIRGSGAAFRKTNQSD